jgi:insulysin
VKDLRILQLIWPLPEELTHFKKKPIHYLSHLLGHEGPGSVLSLLKKKGWANALVAGPNDGI